MVCLLFASPRLMQVGGQNGFCGNRRLTRTFLKERALAACTHCPDFVKVPQSITARQVLLNARNPSVMLGKGNFRDRLRKLFAGRDASVLGLADSRRKTKLAYGSSENCAGLLGSSTGKVFSRQIFRPRVGKRIYLAAVRNAAWKRFLLSRSPECGMEKRFSAWKKPFLRGIL